MQRQADELDKQKEDVNRLKEELKVLKPNKKSTTKEDPKVQLLQQEVRKARPPLFGVRGCWARFRFRPPS